MKGKILVIFSLVLILTAGVSAQENLDQTIDQLKTEIARRETIDRDDTTPAAQRLTNRANLENARTALLKAVESRISALEKYLNTLGDSIKPAERDEVRNSLRQLSSDAHLGVERKSVSVNISNPTTSVTVGSASSSLGNMAPNVAPPPAVLTIIRPPNNSSGEKEVEVVVVADTAPSADLILRATVTNNGSTIDVAEFVMRANMTVGKTTVQLGPNNNVITVTAPSIAGLAASITVYGPEDRKTPFTRAIFGVEQAAAASAKPEQKLFLEFNLTAPLFNDKHKSAIHAPVWLWLNPRITSLPQQISSTVAEFATAPNFVSPFEKGKVNDIAQGFEFLGGVEVKIGGLSKEIPSGFGGETKVRFGVSLVAAGGMSTPFGSQQVAPQFFKVNPTVKERFSVPDGKDFIAFVTADRNRFFRQYYGGLRLKTYYVKKDNSGNWEELDNVFPGVIDLTFGQNESITGGGLFGGIARIDGIYPLPFIRGKYKGSIYVFGSAHMKLNKPKIPPTVILQPPDTPPDILSDKVFIQQLPLQDADHYRLGVGVDLIRLLKP